MYELEPGVVGLSDIVRYPDTGATLTVLSQGRVAYASESAAGLEAVVTEAMRAAREHDA